MRAPGIEAEVFGSFNWLGKDVPKSRRAGTSRRAYLWAAISVAFCTAICLLLASWLRDIQIVMAFLVSNLILALRGNRPAAAAATLLSVASFDFFFVPPRYTFAIADSSYLFTFLVMGLVGVVVSSLTALLAAEIMRTRKREARARGLYALSRILLDARLPTEVLSEGARVLGRELERPVGAWARGPEGQAIALNTAAGSLGSAEREALQKALLGQPDAEGGPKLHTQFLTVGTAERIHGVLGLQWPDDGEERDEEVRSMLETGANQMAIAIDHALAHIAAEAATHQAETERLRSALLSSVSHDLRTPLTGIVGAAGTLVDGAEALTPDVRRELAQGIVEEAERLNRLVTNLLQATRLDAGSVSLVRTWFSVEDVVSPALARLAGPLQGRAITIDFPAELPLVFGDPVLIEQVFSNLVENATKHTPAGTAISLRASCELGWLTVEVADAGPGLPPGEEERVFEKFLRFPSGSGAPGAGLGLAIARGVVAAHGGTIHAESRPGGGACFVFTLPIAPPPRSTAPLNTLPG